ncbi:MAG: hypothetical protein Q8K43_07170, partial [Sulfurimicrobium sp.]|nr:hypothetical protein [Sulfurimicrobium sp.]
MIASQMMSASGIGHHSLISLERRSGTWTRTISPQWLHMACRISPERKSGAPRSLSDLKEIGCKFAWPVHISPLFWAIERLLPCKTGQNLSSPSRIFATILQVRQAARYFSHAKY